MLYPGSHDLIAYLEQSRQSIDEPGTRTSSFAELFSALGAAFDQLQPTQIPPELVIQTESFLREFQGRVRRYEKKDLQRETETSLAILGEMTASLRGGPPGPAFFASFKRLGRQFEVLAQLAGDPTTDAPPPEED